MAPVAARLCLAGLMLMLPAAILAAPAMAQEQTLYQFTCGGDGDTPSSGVLPLRNGALIGTTAAGGSQGLGNLYMLTPPGAAPGWTLQTIFDFLPPATGHRGMPVYPTGGLTPGKKGEVFGAGNAGGNDLACDGAGCGGIYQIAPPARGAASWTETTLYTFSGRADGANPGAPPIQAPSGVLYGTTDGGGAGKAGTLWQLSPPAVTGQPWSFQLLHAFGVNTTDGAIPSGPLLLDKKGNLFGITTYGGGPFNDGTVFELSPPAPSHTEWRERILHVFGATGDGARPIGAIIMDGTGVLYGTTYGGGSSGAGTAWALSPPPKGGGAWSETILHSFAGGADGAYVYGGLTFGPGGTLLGTTAGPGQSGTTTVNNGTLFQLSPPQAGGTGWTLATLFAFTGFTPGADPAATLSIGPSGTVFGTAVEGGLNNNGGTGCGTVFSY